MHQLTHVFALVVKRQGAAKNKGEDCQAGRAQGEDQPMVQVVKHNWLKRNGCETRLAETQWS